MDIGAWHRGPICSIQKGHEVASSKRGAIDIVSIMKGKEGELLRKGKRVSC